MADKSRDMALERAKAYETLRARDKEFWEYHCNLPDYNECESNIQRSKGTAWNRYGSDLRKTRRSLNGFQRHAMVGISQHFSRTAIAESAQRRVTAKTKERARVDDHILQRWDAIISSPTNASVSVNISTAIEASFHTLGSFGKGANSAGLALGSQLWRLTR